jgi:hypothetical protein
VSDFASLRLCLVCGISILLKKKKIVIPKNKREWNGMIIHNL